MSGTLTSARVAATASPKLSQSETLIPMSRRDRTPDCESHGIEGERAEPVIGADPGQRVAGDVALERRLPDGDR